MWTTITTTTTTTNQYTLLFALNMRLCYSVCYTKKGIVKKKMLVACSYIHFMYMHTHVSSTPDSTFFFYFAYANGFCLYMRPFFFSLDI